MRYYILAFKKYFDFNTRSTRIEYWLFFFFNIIFSIVASSLDGILGTSPLLNSVYFIFVFIPSISVAVRRLHDTGRSGWYLLLGLIPIIGWLWVLILLLIDSEKNINKYGPNLNADLNEVNQEPENQL